MLRSLAFLAATCLLALPARAESTATLTVTLPSPTEVETQRVAYDCAGTPLEVAYVNAGSVSLAALTVEGEFQVMSVVLSASGARYAGGRWIWWTKGQQGDLYDLTQGESAPPVMSCRAG